MRARRRLSFGETRSRPRVRARRARPLTKDGAAPDQLTFLSTPTGTCLTTRPSGPQGHAGTRADFFSFSMASTMARTPFSVEVISGVLAEVPDISETM